MRVTTLSYDARRGWSASFPSVGDSGSLVICFGAPGYRERSEPIAALADAYRGSAVIGCSTSGEIHGLRVEDHSLSVAVVDFASSTVRRSAVPVSAENSFVAGKELGARLDGEGLRWVFVLSDGLDVNGSDLARGLGEALDPGVVVTGGLAGDGSDFVSTWTLVDGRPRAGWATAIGVYGDDLVIGHGSRGGWDIFGPERVVTRSHRSVLYELDGRPALALYKEYLGDLADGLPATGLLFPLSLRRPGDDARLVRTILSVDETDQSLTFAGDVPEGHRAQLMQANFDRLVGGAESAAHDARQAVTGGDVLSVAISCVGRRLVLGERSEDELEATLAALPDGTAQVGFYSYGELSPFVDGTACDLHNQTMTLTTVSERS